LNRLQKQLIENPLGKLFGYIHAYIDKCDRYQRYSNYRKRFEIAPSFLFVGNDIILDGLGKIICGAGSYISHRTLLYASKNTTLKIGANCQIAADFYARTENNVSNQLFTGKASVRVKGNITVGDGCWIGRGVYVREGISIGDQCVVGAGSVVVSDLPAYSICVGVPCKPIKFKKEDSCLSLRYPALINAQTFDQ
jgi:acetyltransferase-like isoleucine patch superfamily enzyme